MRFEFKIILSLLFIINSFTIYGQKIIIYGGINNNFFHDYNNNKGHYTSSYQSALGYCTGVGLDSVKIDWLTFSFTLQIDKYAGELKAYDGGLGGGSSTEAIVDKLIISLGIFPINFQIFHKINLNIGFEISRLLNENFKGTTSGWLMGQSDWNYSIQDIYDHYSSKTFFGLRGSISYDFNISKSLIISPQYSYYFGLSNEFQEFPQETKSMRHYLFIEIKKRIQ